LKVHARELLRNPLVIAVGASLVVAILLTLLWTATPLREQLTPQNASDWVTSIAARWWAPWLLLLLLVLTNLIVFPRPLLTIAAVVAFGAWKGFALSMAGAEIATFIGYYAGYRCPRPKIERWAGRTLTRMAPLLHRNGLVTMSMLRLLPIGPHVLGSVAAGALRIRLWHVFVGTFIGMAPGLVGTTLVGVQVANGMAPGGHVNHWVLWGSVMAIVVLIALTKVWYSRLSAQAASPS
jgi:phospholipase D1/2